MKVSPSGVLQGFDVAPFLGTTSSVISRSGPTWPMLEDTLGSQSWMKELSLLWGQMCILRATATPKVVGVLRSWSGYHGRSLRKNSPVYNLESALQRA